jgi:hypothetical protein
MRALRGMQAWLVVEMTEAWKKTWGKELDDS